MSALPFKYRLANKIGSAKKKLGLKDVSLDEEKLINRAIQQTGLLHFGDEAYRKGLKKLIESIDASDMMTTEKLALRNTIVFNLTRRLLLEDAKRKDADVFKKTLHPPLIVLGFPRTGTTILHRLLALDPNNKAYTMLELNYPFPWIDIDRYRPHMQQSYDMMKKIMPDLDKKHEVGVDIPEECINVLGPTFSSFNYYIQSNVPDYMRWCFETDQTRKYREYRDYLYLLQARAPEKRPTMKSPFHMAGVKPLHDAVPEAMMIQTHRDPEQFIVSTNSLFKTLHLRKTPEQIKQMARDSMDFFEGMMKANLEQRKEVGEHIYDVMYTEIVKDPVGVIRGIYDHYKIDWPENYENIILDYLKVNKKNKHGKHSYSLEEFGLTSELIRDKMKPYTDQFFSKEVAEKETV